jgi:hypothetical protein
MSESISTLVLISCFSAGMTDGAMAVLTEALADPNVPQVIQNCNDDPFITKQFVTGE